MREIGSEFWLERELKTLSRDRDGVYALSGRTAIDLIIQDVVKTRRVRNVYMPAWGCDSMLAPFVAEIAQEKAGVIKVGKVNVDEAPDLAAKYGINSIPALFLFKGGQVSARAVGFMKKDELARFVSQ